FGERSIPEVVHSIAAREKNEVNSGWEPLLKSFPRNLWINLLKIPGQRVPSLDNCARLQIDHFLTS
ncbi:MAG: hypothetical protein ABJ186_04490, partial [Marinobacter sp.]|uniref:hypothetical protein n=1 Tax=Marinobacter sp. TaxID=50741 RepID=UPI003299B72F